MIVDFHRFSKARLISGDRGLSWEPPVFRQVTSITPGSSWSTSVLPVSKATPWALLDKIQKKAPSLNWIHEDSTVEEDPNWWKTLQGHDFFLKPMPSVYGISILVSLASQAPQFWGLSLYPISLLSFTGGNLWWPIQQLRNASATLAWESWYKTFSQLLQNIPNT